MMKILKLIVDQLAAKGEQKKKKTICTIQKYTQSPPYKARISYNCLSQNAIPV